jgi:hypothetical protein
MRAKDAAADFGNTTNRREFSVYCLDIFTAACESSPPISGLHWLGMSSLSLRRKLSLALKPEPRIVGGDDTELGKVVGDESGPEHAPVSNIEPDDEMELLDVRRCLLSGALSVIGPISRIPLGTRADPGAGSMPLLVSPLVPRLGGLEE